MKRDLIWNNDIWEELGIYKINDKMKNPKRTGNISQEWTAKEYHRPMRQRER